MPLSLSLSLSLSLTHTHTYTHTHSLSSSPSPSLPPPSSPPLFVSGAQPTGGHRKRRKSARFFRGRVPVCACLSRHGAFQLARKPFAPFRTTSGEVPRKFRLRKRKFSRN